MGHTDSFLEKIPPQAFSDAGDAMLAGDNNYFHLHHPHIDLTPFVSLVENKTQYLLLRGDAQDYLENCARCVEGYPILEDAFDTAFAQAMTVLLKNKSFTRLNMIINSCAGNPKLESLLQADLFLPFKEKYLQENDVEGLARLQALKRYKFLEPEIFEFRTEAVFHLFPIGATQDSDLIITTAPNATTGISQIFCHTGNFIGTPAELVQHWRATEESQQKWKSHDLEQQQKLEQAIFGSQQRAQKSIKTGPPNPHLYPAASKTIYLLKALIELKKQDPGLEPAFDETIDALDQLTL